jgi:hypothetical protein
MSDHKHVNRQRLGPGRVAQVDDNPAYLHEIEHLALVGVLIELRELDQAMRFLERLRQAAESAGRVRSLIQILALWAVALQARSNSDQALATLARALCFWSIPPLS